MDSLEDEIPLGYPLLKRSYQDIKVFVPIGVLGK